jgi:SAM-dependent methyltransferase
VGSRYQFLLDNFGEVTAKTGGGREIKNPLLNPYPLSDGDRAQLRELASKGVFVSDHQELRSAEYLDGLLKDRFENSVHVDVIGSLVGVSGARILELRPRTGAISESLRRLFGAEVCAMPIWESQRFLLKEVYGIDSPGLINYDRFEIPYAGQFDLIVGNHMLTHSVRPADFFATIRTRLKPGGHVYLYNEPDDAEFLSGQQSMLATLNPLHMQAFDHKSLRRGLAASGFEVVFQKRRNVNHMCLARLSESPWAPMSELERKGRIKAYRKARDRAILGMREELRPRFAAEWSAIVERGVAEGVVEFDANGRLRLVAQ